MPGNIAPAMSVPAVPGNVSTPGVSAPPAAPSAQPVRPATTTEIGGSGQSPNAPQKVTPQSAAPGRSTTPFLKIEPVNLVSDPDFSNPAAWRVSGGSRAIQGPKEGHFVKQVVPLEGGAYPHAIRITLTPRLDDRYPPPYISLHQTYQHRIFAPMKLGDTVVLRFWAHGTQGSSMTVIMEGWGTKHQAPIVQGLRLTPEWTDYEMRAQITEGYLRPAELWFCPKLEQGIIEITGVRVYLNEPENEQAVRITQARRVAPDEELARAMRR